MNTLAPTNNLWYSIHVPIMFGADAPFYPQVYISVNDDGNGNAVFTRGNFTLYPFYEQSTQFFVDSGIYAGFHSVTSYDSTTNEIFTTTPFIGNDPTPPIFARGLYQIVPFGYRVYYGYPTQNQTIDIRAFHKFDGTAYVDIGSILKNVVEIQPPTGGYDNNMFTYFRVDYIPLDDFATFLNTLSLNINVFTGWNYLTQTYFALNSAIPHAKLQTLVLNNDWISEANPVFFGDCCNTMTKIINNRPFNYYVCPTTQGIGSMEILDNFIIN